MPGLSNRTDDGAGGEFPDGRCRECGQRSAAGPCAACEVMICGDCGVFSRDPGGVRVICISCARLVADVSARPLRRDRPGLRVIAIIALVAFAALALTLL